MTKTKRVSTPKTPTTQTTEMAEPAVTPVDGDEADEESAPDAVIPERRVDMFNMGALEAKLGAAKRKAADAPLIEEEQVKAMEIDYSLPPAEDVDPLDKSDGNIRNLNDIMATFPIGSPEGHFVQVERRAPRLYGGQVIQGTQRPLIGPMDMAVFSAQYGSGTYYLTVYGPTKSKQRDANGDIRSKALTKPIRVDVPDPFRQNPPNPDMANVAAPILEEMEYMAAEAAGVQEMTPLVNRRMPGTTGF